jgi:hypothetical protein
VNVKIGEWENGVHSGEDVNLVAAVAYPSGKIGHVHLRPAPGRVEFFQAKSDLHQVTGSA